MNLGNKKKKRFARFFLILYTMINLIFLLIFFYANLGDYNKKRKNFS